MDGSEARRRLAMLPRHEYAAWIPLAAMLAAAGCSPESAPGSGSPTGAAAETLCTSAGPLSCPVPPFESLDADRCAAVTSCLAGRPSDAGVIAAAAACERPTLAAGTDASVAAFGAALDTDGPPAHAAFLFVERENGWCPADTLLSPTWNHGGYCETSVRLVRERRGEPLLVALAQRICRRPLDQQEISAGESDVALTECRRKTYRLEDGSLTSVSETLLDGPCEVADSGEF